jgi:putative SOS response-associated peptidase YedK
MCGRVIRTTPGEVLQQLFDLLEVPLLTDRYNLAPTDPIPVIRTPRRLELLRWGLEMPGPRMAGINARVESLAKPIYRDKLQNKRCLVVVDGFFEWKTVAGKKHPYLIAYEDRRPMVMAGIYDSSGGCAILTAPSQGAVAPLHDRMPVVLEPDAFSAWIDPSVKDVRSILSQANASRLITYPVGRGVNSVRNDDPTLIERAPEPSEEPPKGKTLSLF